jgi:hypothetical protein
LAIETKERKAMDSRVSSVSRSELVMIESTSRPTPKPARVPFREVLAAGARGLVQGAEVALSKLPGSPITAAAVRGSPGGPSTPMTVMSATGVPVNASPEGPVGTVSMGLSAALGGSALGSTGVGGPTDQSGGIEAAMQQSAQLSLYYLQVQQQEDAQNRTFTALSNVLKTEHDSAKAAINNIHA